MNVPNAAANTAATLSQLQRFKNFWCRTRPRRVISLLALAAMFAGAGFLVGKLIYILFGQQQTLEVLKTVTYVGVVVAIWKVLADNWLGIWNFLTQDNRTQLSRPLSQLAIAVTGAGLVAGTDPPGPAPILQASIVLASSVIAGPDQVTRTVDTRRVMLPYFYKNVEDPKPGSLSDEELKIACDNNLETLATVDPAGVTTLKTLACGLRTCSTAKRPVRVDVRGFASSRSFSCGGRNSADLNLKLAERRRTKVIEILNGNLKDAANCASDEPPGTLEYQPAAADLRWSGDYELMQRNRDLDDVPEDGNGKADRSREILSRRVDVVILDAGACGTLTAAPSMLANAQVQP